MKNIDKNILIKIFSVLAVVFAMRTYFEHQNSKEFDRELQFKQEQYITVLYESVNQTLLALDRMAARHLGEEKYLYHLWWSDAENYYNHFGTFQSIDWINNKNIIEWIYPLKGNESLVGIDLGLEEKREKALTFARINNESVITKPIALARGGYGFLSIHPTYQKQSISGYIVGVFNGKRLFSSFVDDKFNINVEIDGDSVFNQFEKNEITKKRGRIFKKSKDIRKTTWTFTVVPSDSVITLRNKDYFKRQIYFLIIFLLFSFIIVYQSKKSDKESKLKTDLSKSNSYLGLALEGAGLGVWDWDLKTDEVKFDKRWVEMIGLSLDQIVHSALTWQDRVHPDDLEQAKKDIKDYFSGKTDHYENIHRMKHVDGHYIHILARGRFSEYDDEGKPIRFTGTHLDISAKNEIAKDLSMVLENVSVGIWSYNPRTEKLQWDHSMFNIYENKSSSFQNRLEDWISFIYEKERENVLKEFNQSLVTNQKFDIKYRIQTPKGTEKFIRSRAVVERDENKKAVSVNGVNIDVTKETIAFNQAKEQIRLSQHQAKLSSLGELAAGVGHEINNPLTVIKGYIDTIKRKEVKGQINIDPLLKSYLEKINKASERIEKIIGGLRTFSTANVSESMDFDPIESVRECYNIVNEIYYNEGINVSFNNQIKDKNIFIHGSKGKFQQIIMNTISNAKDAVENSLVKEIKINCFFNNDFFEVDIKDSARGVPESLQKKIFDPFFTTKEVQKGTGIGLSLANNFIKEFQGEIGVVSEVNEGSLFKLTFKVNKLFPKYESKKEDTVIKEKHIQGKVMIVDDESHILELLQIVLEEFGLEVISASNGKEAYEKYLKQNKIDLIISDMKMPIMDGPEFLKSINENKEKTKPKFIFMTGGIDVDLKAEFKGQIDGYIYKPFEDESIYDMIDQCLN